MSMGASGIEQHQHISAISYNCYMLNTCCEVQSYTNNDSVSIILCLSHVSAINVKVADQLCNRSSFILCVSQKCLLV